MILRNTFAWLKAQIQVGWVPFIQLVLYVGAATVIGCAVVQRGHPRLLAQHNMVADRVIERGDVVAEARSLIGPLRGPLLGPPLWTPADFVGRYLTRPVKCGDVLEHDSDTSENPVFPPETNVLWLAPSEVRFVDAQPLDAGEFVDVCAAGEGHCTRLHVGAVSCDPQNREKCRVGLVVSADQRAALLKVVGGLAASQARPRIDLIRTY